MAEVYQAIRMNIDGQAWRTIGLEPDGRSVWVIDQTQLPHRFGTRSLSSCEQAAAKKQKKERSLQDLDLVE